MIKRKSLLSQGCGAHYIQRNKEENDIRLLTGNNTSQKTVKHLKIIEKKNKSHQNYLRSKNIFQKWK